jgi:hypothetical protein
MASPLSEEWDRKALRQASKSDQRKVRLAARLRKNTTMSLKWIAEHLQMVSWTHVSNLLGAYRKRESLKSENSHLRCSHRLKPLPNKS